MQNPKNGFDSPGQEKNDNGSRLVVGVLFLLLILGGALSVFIGSRGKSNHPVSGSKTTTLASGIQNTGTPKPKVTPTSAVRPTPTPIPLMKVARRVHRNVERNVEQVAREKAKSKALSLPAKILDDKQKKDVAQEALAQTYAKYAGKAVSPTIYTATAQENALNGARRGNLDVASPRLGQQVAKEAKRRFQPPTPKPTQ